MRLAVVLTEEVVDKRRGWERRGGGQRAGGNVNDRWPDPVSYKHLVKGLGFKVSDSPLAWSSSSRNVSDQLKVPNLSSDGRSLSVTVCRAKNDLRQVEDGEENGALISSAQFACWAITAIYVVWLFILPYAPGDPAWAISPATIQMLIDLSLNFFFVLPFTAYFAELAGIHGLAPVLHPMDEGLFNFVIGWSLLFAPLLFTDRKRDRFGGSLEGLWVIQMFLTNTVLAPYMAIRLNREKANRKKNSWENSLSGALTRGAKYLGLVGAAVGAISVLWALFGRPDGGFGGIEERWVYLLEYINRERLAYAFIWDIVLYTLFQPWLIGENLGNVREENRELVGVLRFVPYVGLVVYVLGLREEVKKV
ncbi:hypothetical protein R1sor_020083 [Riccia sorocarpa]|uniref:Uncharacterized protein n=1 Tax=Riccia sorocarpa TaxID=122646 RepID=A0ABD3IFG9_9MARC